MPRASIVRSIVTALTLLSAALASSSARAEIKDNSFFIEEAYNQDPGVVQHIFNWIPQWDRNAAGSGSTFNFSYTCEMPVGGVDNQFSYTIPVTSFAVDPLGGPSASEGGLGDIQLNYRYQLLKEEIDGVAFAPRASVILPSGDERRGLGVGVTGYQFNLPFSKQLKDYAVHFNAGTTIDPGVHGAFRDFDLVGYNLGASCIYTKNGKIQPLVEVLALWNSSLDDSGLFVDRPFQAIVSPGVRFQIYQVKETQVVGGLAIPVGLSEEAPNIGVFFYFSIERKSPVLAWLKGDDGSEIAAATGK